VINQIKY